VLNSISWHIIFCLCTFQLLAFFRVCCYCSASTSLLHVFAIVQKYIPTYIRTYVCLNQLCIVFLRRFVLCKLQTQQKGVKKNQESSCWKRVRLVLSLHIFQTREYNLCFTIAPTARVLYLLLF